MVEHKTPLLVNAPTITPLPNDAPLPHIKAKMRIYGCYCFPHKLCMYKIDSLKAVNSGKHSYHILYCCNSLQHFTAAVKYLASCAVFTTISLAVVRYNTQCKLTTYSMVIMNILLSYSTSYQLYWNSVLYQHGGKTD